MAAAHRLRAEREATAKRLEASQRQLEQLTGRVSEAEAALEACQAQRSSAQGSIVSQVERRAQGEEDMAKLEDQAKGAD